MVTSTHLRRPISSQTLALILSAVLMIGLAGGAYAQEAAPQPQEFVSEDYGFVIEFPGSWMVTTEIPGTVVAALSPQEGPEDTFMENVVITAEKLPPDMTLSEYLDAVISVLSKTMAGFEVVKTGEARSDYCEFLWVTYHVALGKPDLVQNIHLTIRDGIGFAIIGSATPDSFEAYAPEFEAAVASFRFR